VPGSLVGELIRRPQDAMTASTAQRSPRGIRPLADFLHAEAAGGVVLVAATAVALVWANSPWKDSYHDLWSTEIVLSVGSHVLALDLKHWVNDALMAIFFLVVGLEIKRELVQGELRDPRRAALPAIAALGGMVVPALFYLAVAGGGAAADGWGIPMATDIAMAVGVVALLGSRVHSSLKLFLLALAIVDDIGAIVVIAIFYSGSIDGAMLLLAGVALTTIVLLRVLGVWWTPAYVLIGGVLWLALHEAGIHATLAGVACGLLAPTAPHIPRDLIDEDELVDVSSVAAARATVDQARSSVSVVEWLEQLLHPWTSFVIVPIFALANAGVFLGEGVLGDAASSRVSLAIVVGLVIGKPVGITLASWLAVRFRAGELPEGASWRSLIGVASIAGIGFTVSLFVTDLAFDDEGIIAEAKIGVLAASLLSALVGTLLVVTARRRREGQIV
jgi:NhaA family Na+:H+ antiporter